MRVGVDANNYSRPPQPADIECALRMKVPSGKASEQGHTPHQYVSPSYAFR